MEPSPVALRVETDLRPGGDLDPLVDDDLPEPRIAADVDAVHEDALLDTRIGIDPHAREEDRPVNGPAREDATVGDHGMIDLCAVDFRAGQEARAGEDRRVHVEKIEPWQFRSEIKVGFEEGADRSDVFPITLEHVGIDAIGLNGMRNDVLAEIGVVVVEQMADQITAE